LITVATWNIRAAIGPGPFPSAWWRRIDPDRLAQIADATGALDADVVALQEVGVVTVDGALIDLPAELARLTGLDGRYAAVGHFPLVEPETSRVAGSYLWGNAILTRHAIRSSRTIALPVGADDDVVEPVESGHPLAGIRFADAEPGAREPRCALVCEVDLAGGPVTILSTHLTHVGSGQRALQAAELAAVIAACVGPFALLGDLNAPIDDPALAPLVPRADPLDPAGAPLVDAFAAVGVPAGDARRVTCDGVWPIDHVLVRGLTPVACRVVGEVGDLSDHWPVVAVLER